MDTTPATLDLVQDYYGRQLQGTTDLKTSACCDISAVPEWLKPLLARIHPEVLSRYYGCGLVTPPLLEGCRVLDLGCGSGRDVYALAQLVGPGGEVVGVDMTDEQLAVARAHQAHHEQVFGYGNLRFFSATYRLFKLDTLESACEDYGQAVIYRGTIPEHPGRFVLDKHHDIPTGKVFPVCGNTWHMLHGTRFAPHFEFIGNFDTHYGILAGCSTRLPFDAGGTPDTTAGPGACC